MAFPYQKHHSVTPFACGTTGSQTICHLTALVAKHFQWITPCPVSAVGTRMLLHNQLRNFTASILQEVCHDVALEPPLQPISGDQLHRAANASQEARLDISARGFWGDRFTGDFST